MTDKHRDVGYERTIAVMLNEDLVKRLAQLRERVEDLEAALAAAHASATEPQWIVNDIAELGVIVGARAFFLYKGRSIEYEDSRADGEPRLYRPVGKREFGEVCEPVRVVKLRCKREKTPEDTAYLLSKRYTDGDGWRELSTLCPEETKRADPPA